MTEKPVRPNRWLEKARHRKAPWRSTSTHTARRPEALARSERCPSSRSPHPSSHPRSSRRRPAPSPAPPPFAGRWPDNKAPVISAEKTRPRQGGRGGERGDDGRPRGFPAFAEEAATATSSGEISPSRGWWTSPCSESGLLAVQGNKKAEAAKAGGKGAKGGKKKK